MEKKNNGHKIDSSSQNFIDIFLLSLCEKVAPTLHRMHITPNMVTMFGLCTGVASIYCLLKKKYALCILLLWITYWSDCLDGYMARKYGQITRLGDFLDHFRDNFVIISISVLIIMQFKAVPMKIVSLFIILISAFLMTIQLGCQEKITDISEHNQCLNGLKALCPHNPHHSIQISKWFGCGTFFMVLTIIIICLQFQKKRDK